MIYETERLFTREMTPADLPALSSMLQDPLVMIAYEGAFSDEETLAWLHNQTRRYQKAAEPFERHCSQGGAGPLRGFGLWAVVLKASGRMIGQCGLTLQDFDGREVLELGYLFQKAFWGRGYAIEAARGAKEYAFTRLGAEEVFSIVRDTNFASMNVAIRNGMLVRGRFIKHYRGVDMPHYAFSVRKKSSPGPIT